MGQTCTKDRNGVRCSALYAPKRTPSLVCVEARRSSLFNLCPHEVCVIRRAWKSAKASDIGPRVVVSILTKRPHFTSFFDLHPGTPAELMEAPSVRSHGLRMTAFLDEIIRSLGAVDEQIIGQMIHGVGMIHFHKGVNFNAENWLLFKTVLLEELCRSSGRTPRPQLRHKAQEMEAAWNKLLRFVISEMKRGFLGEALKRGESESSG